MEIGDNESTSHGKSPAGAAHSPMPEQVTDGMDAHHRRSAQAL
jgi:hypothetical protein